MMRAAAWLVELFTAPDESEAILGDLGEEFEARADQDGAASAKKWYVRQCLSTMYDLSIGTLKARPAVAAAMGVAGLASTWPLGWASRAIATQLVIRWPVYMFVPAQAFWTGTSIATSLAAGLLIGTVARRAMAGLAAVLCVCLALFLVIAPSVIIWTASHQSPLVQQRFGVPSLGSLWWQGLSAFAAFAPAVIVGAVVGRKLRTRSHERRRQTA
jgi:hypothetical protein